MLARLEIENFALVDRLAIEFHPQLNILTGETGAGKSILIDALRFVLGERFDGRAPDKVCCVEAAFDIEIKDPVRHHSAFADYFSRGEEALILRREIQPPGKTRAWINGRSVNLSDLKQIGSHLIDIHGQYDHQVLLDAKTHLEWLDRFAKADALKLQYAGLYQEYEILLKRRRELEALKETSEREADLLKFQINEIEKAALETGEEESLQTERLRLANAEKLHETASHALDLLEDQEGAASSLVGQAMRDLTALAKLDPSLDSLKSQFEAAQLQMEEALRTLRDYRDNLSFDAGRLGEIESRLDQIELLKRKYGGSVDKALEFLAAAKAKYDPLVHRELYDKEIEGKLTKLLPGLERSAEALTDKRHKTALALKRQIEEELKDLQLPNARFEGRFEKTDFAASGRDGLEFFISLNPGHPPMELRKVISAGEVSRVMLALKKVLMEIDPMSTLIFDEIDANIGGRLGTVTGKKLKEISASHQVLLITHLPQIASFADRHFKVKKVIRQGRTVAEYAVIDGEERVKELAQMMSGQKETDISKKHAEEMLSRVGRP